MNKMKILCEQNQSKEPPHRRSSQTNAKCTLNKKRFATCSRQNRRGSDEGCVLIRLHHCQLIKSVQIYTHIQIQRLYSMFRHAPFAAREIEVKVNVPMLYLCGRARELRCEEIRNVKELQHLREFSTCNKKPRARVAHWNFGIERALWYTTLLTCIFAISAGGSAMGQIRVYFLYRAT